ncbi:MAG: chemotaxis protein CheW [bacterium]|nr:chemotaxis protein CheW [bacterium]MDT8394897.1 chemotaxis protein CheW [bacterium]
MGDTRMITFALGRHRFAIPIEDIREVINIESVVPVPGGRRPLEGIIPYRDNAVLPVFSLLDLLGHEHEEKSNLVVVTGTRDTPVGFRVRQMGGVMASVAEDKIVAYDGALGGGGKAVSGVLIKPGGEHILLSMKHVFAF